MKVKDLIKKLKTFDPELPVALADWNEGWRCPDERAVVVNHYVCERYTPESSNDFILGDFVCIGSND